MVEDYRKIPDGIFYCYFCYYCYQKTGSVVLMVDQQPVTKISAAPDRAERWHCGHENAAWEYISLNHSICRLTVLLWQ